MNYGGNMPDWHQYNTSQTTEVTTPTQNVNSGHLAFIPGVSSSTLNAIGLNSEGLNKHQSNANFNSRNFQSYNNVSSGPNIANNNPLASMVQMQNCIGHYGSPNTRNPMLDNVNVSVDPRTTTIGTINDEIGYRNNQVPFNGPISHLSGPSCNLNASSGPASGPGPISGPRTNSGSGIGSNPNSGTGPGPIFGHGSRHAPAPGHGSGSGSGNMGPRNTNIGSVPHPGKSGPLPSFIPCKGLCCNSDPNINYQQWEKFGSYQNNASYRDSMHPSNYQMENRHFGNNCNFRKDNLEGKEVMGSVLPNTSGVDHRRNFADYKYHKDHLVHRNYPTSTGMYHNYTMQGYNYSAEQQKYPYPVKEHTKTNNMNISNSGMLKQQEQNFIAQQKFNNKQFQYQDGNMLPKGVPTLNVNTNIASSPQNPYYNSHYPRNISTEMSHECQETTDNTTMVNRMQNTYMHSSPSQHQVYQHKIAMQKFSIENHLREMSRIPGYQSHPKYKECILRYREVLKLQQSSSYQNPVQQASRVATPVNATVPPINLQFDQNGMLINSSYLSDGFHKLQHAPPVGQASENISKQNKEQAIAIANEKCQQPQQPEELMVPQQSEHVPSSSCAETFQKQNQFSIRKDFNQNQLKVQTSESQSFDTLTVNTSNETMMQQKPSKQFANKPDLDVRQFLANWDETDDEEGTTNLPNAVLNETTPVVVVSYENVNLSSKTPQRTDLLRRNSFCSNDTSESGKESEANVIAAQGLTISYSSSDNAELAKTSKRTIGEGVMKPGSIIHCISNGPDEIPTIHIVDNLEISNILGASSDQVVQTLEKQKTISFFRESSNNETEEMDLENTEQPDKSDTRVLPANYGTSLDEGNKNAMEGSSISEVIQASTVSMNNQELRTLSTSEKNNLDASDNIGLKKQHSFEESHNPDDISLPDLPTSECTPISTTLNTPTHSDSEESSQNMEDLSISTNPIEVMQNSPVISFTQLNSEENVKDTPLGSLELEFRKENRYKSNEANSGHEEEVTLNNFDFSSSSKSKSSETTQNKQVKNFGANAGRKKVFLIDGKESDSRVSDTCGNLTSMRYELEIQQETVEGEKGSDRRSPNFVHEGRHKSVKESTETTKTAIQSGDSISNIGSNANLDPTESEDESQELKNEKDLFRRKKRKASTTSTNINCPTSSEIDSNTKKGAKEAISWDDKCIDKYLDKNLIQKRDADHLRQSKGTDARKIDNSRLLHTGEHSVCHTTSQHKHYSVAVIKDNVTLNDKRSHGTTDKIVSEKFTEIPSKMNNTTTKEFSEETKTKKHVSNKTISSLQESVQSQTSRLLQKDLKTTDGDVKYTAEEIRLLREYRKKKERLHQAQDTRNDNNRDEKIKSKNRPLKTVEELQKVHENSFHHRNKLECSQIRQNNEVLAARKVCLEQNSISSVISLNTENLETQEEAKGYSYSKNLTKNANFGIQVANVNLKIKDNDTGKELTVSDKGQEHAKDSLEGIKIEINVSCTDRNLKGQEQNKRILYDDRSLYEIDDSFSSSNTLDCQRKLHAKDQENNSKLSEKLHTMYERSCVAMNAADTSQTKSDHAETNSSTTLKKGGRASFEANEEINSIVSKETNNLASDSQSFNKLLRGNVSSKDTQKTEVIETTDYAIDHVDIIKSKSAISNTAITDANNTVKGNGKSGSDREDNCTRVEDDRVTRVQKEGSTSLMDISGVLESETASVSHLKSSKKLPENSLVELSAKSLNTLSNLDFNLDKFEYKKFSGVTNLDRVHRLDEGMHVGKWKKPKIDDIFEDCDMFQSSSGYVNPIFSSVDKLEDLHTVPVYTTKDGKISYSPNRRFTYHELMMEARKREASSSGRKCHYMDTWNNYYTPKFRKLYKRKRHHGLSDRKKHEYKSTKYLYDRKRNYSDEFCSRSHAKYKDYVHSIRNNNAVWSDHCKVDKMCSSSDSDEEIIDHNKSCDAEANSSKKSQVSEGDIVNTSLSHKNEVVMDELDLERKSDKDNTVVDLLNKNDRMNLKVAESIQILDINADNPNCRSVDNNCKDNLVSNVQQDFLSTLIESNHEKEDVETGVDKIELLTPDNVEIVPENLQTSENKDSNNECIHVAIDKIENKIIFEDEKNVGSKDEMSISKLLNENSLLDEDNLKPSLYNLEEKEGNEKIVSKESDVKEQEEESNKMISDNQTFSLETGNNSENMEHMETNKDLVTDQFNVVESEVEIANNVCELQADSDVTEHVSQVSLESETFNTISGEIVAESDGNIDQENILELEEEHIHFGEEVEIPNEEQILEEDMDKDTEENIEFLEYQSDDNLLNDTSLMNQEEFESQMVEVDVLSSELNSEHIPIETIEHVDNINTDFDQVSNVISKEQSSTNFTNKEVPIENKNVIENVVILNKDEMDIVLSNIEETPMKLEVVANSSKNKSNLNDQPCIYEHETDPGRNSSVEKEIPIPNMYCTIKSSPTVESNEDKAASGEQNDEQRHSLDQTFCKTSTSSSVDNADVKAIPKLVIKKADTLNSKSECSLNYKDSSENYNKYDAKLLSEVRPKIPKMIIVKSRSRSVTPTIDILEKTKSDKMQVFLPEQNEENMNADNSDSELYTLKYNNYENKIPKVKIKLDDISSKDLKLYLKRKAAKKYIPKVRIKKFKLQENKRFDMEDSSETETTDSDEEDNNLQESMTSDVEIERIPKLKLKRQEEGRSLSPEGSRGKDSNVSKVFSKRIRKTKEEVLGHSITHGSTTAISDELKKKFPQCMIEKIPKVIIKRTQIGTEFKCEISKSKKTLVAETSKWQPKVKLQRLEVLDHMVKNLKQSKITVKDELNSLTRVKDNSSIINKEDPIYDCRVKLYRSNSVSSLSPVKCKQRRLSDSGYTKVSSKLATEFDDKEIASLKLNDSERNLKRKGKRKLFSRNKHESEDEMKETETKHSFRNILMNEDNDLMVVKKEYSSFGTKESVPLIEKFLNPVMHSRNDDDNDNSIIKVDSSDESQTTIEILPASPHSSEDETKNTENTDRINIEDAIPTQLELELELMDNNNMCSGILASEIDYASHSKSNYTTEGSNKVYFNEFQYLSQNTFGHNSVGDRELQNSEKRTNNYFYCNDLLVKEVLAAKETLKKCLSRPENEDTERKKSRTRTVAEKKQGIGFNFKDLGKEAHSSNDNDNVKESKKSRSLEKKGHKSPRNLEMQAVEEKCSKQEKTYSIEYPTASTCGDSIVPEPNTISLKATKKSNPTAANQTSANISDQSNKYNNDSEESQEGKSEKKVNSNIQDQKDNDNSNETKTKEDNMPLLVPEFSLNFDSSSDRDSSRSPPVITNQEEVDQLVENAKLVESTMINQQIEKVQENEKHSYKDCEMTIADIITQLAYHEKATIRHKRYCNLCERWFPTTARHRRHLAGYQHRYMELSQRKSIHALFILFTGKPCPRLLSANVIRSDCSIGELTPLQIAVQDVAKCVEYTHQDHKMKE